MRQRVNKFKEGAASFYMVAIATLILVIVAASFAAVVISELARTSNNDLAQSAYDSAMAGVEDAKLAYSNYLNCVDSNSAACREIVDLANSGECTSVAKILGRIKDENEMKTEVAVTEGENNNMEQYYTCALLELQPDDYVTTITSSNPTKVIKVDLADGNSAKDINVVRISWRVAQADGELNYNDFKDNKVTFSGTSENNEAASPPTVGVGIIQTAGSFSLSDFEMTRGEGDNKTTDRGMIYLVPSRDPSEKRNDANYEVGDDGPKNYISKSGLLKSNDKTAQNKPYVVYCPENESGENGGYTCTATIELPEPVGGERSDDTFVMILTLPSQGAPEIVASLEFCKGEECTVKEVNSEGEEVATKTSVKLGMQVVVDVTGRANDLYRRVETRLEAPGTGSAALFSSFALQAMGGIKKIQQATCEANFYSSDEVSNCSNI